MSLVTKLVLAAKAFDRRVWPNHRIALTRDLVSRLKNDKLRIADVGSADGPEDRWLTISDLTQFITFEPNTRSESNSPDNTVNFPIGLWSRRDKMPLYITAHPDSSSLCKINREVFDDYLIQLGSQVVKQIEIEVSTLDACLETKGKEGLTPHFLKIDVEGGDLEVMKGAEGTILSSVLGIRTEAVLRPLWVGCPELWDVNKHLRSKGFALFTLGKVQWIRNNGLFGYTSQPQLIWGDAVFFLAKEPFIKRMESISIENREILLIHFTVILLAHGCHDYALEIVETVKDKKLVNEANVSNCEQSIRNSVDKSCFVILWLAMGAAFALLVYLVFCLVKPTREHAKFYLKQRLGRFCSSALRWTGKAGRPYGASIEDQYD
ncbi:MAG TPA: FkbM family methyltransferase [Verrucomicrobiae bacterium]